MIIRPYRKINNNYIPSVQIHFVNPDDFSFNFYEYGLLDTGGDISIFPSSLTFRLNIFNLRERGKQRVKGISRQKILATPYLVNLSFDDLYFFDSIIYSLPEEELGNQIIIGRNILNRFSIRFDGIDKRIVINP